MIKFAIYLIESGLCLSLLYLGYWGLLRKETYFNFNRTYLVGSLLLAMIVPLLHIGFILPENSPFYSTAKNIDRFQQSYSDLVAMLDADFGTEPEQIGTSALSASPSHSREFGLEPEQIGQQPGRNSEKRTRHLLPKLLLIIYISGVLFFLSRLLYLLIRLSFLTKRNPVRFQDGFRLVEIQDDISPFSFFRFLFINSKNLDSSELENVLEHERAHIMQRHSYDHLFAHALAIFQWFNPFAWKMRNALKTTHEFIADRQVITKGYKLYDYQSLLLKQVIGYHSVELVNNFNLKPIKKRINMMTKNKPGFPAKLKATLVIPVTIIAFLLFAEFSLPAKADSFISLNNSPANEMQGLWVKTSKDPYPEFLFIESKNGINTMSIINDLEDQVLKLSRFDIHDNRIILKNSPGMKGLEFDLKGDNLNISWNEKNAASSYKKCKAENTLDYSLQKAKLDIDLPVLTQYRVLDAEQEYFTLHLLKKKDKSISVLLNWTKVEPSKLERLIQEEKSKYNAFEYDKFTAVLYIDKDIPMGEVIKIRKNIGLSTLRFAEAGYPHDSKKISPLLYHRIALSRLMPPPNQPYADKELFDKNGTNVLTIDLSKRNTSPGEIDNSITAHIKNHSKYIISLEYDKDIPYGQYIETVDMIFNIVYKFRNELAMKKYGVSYGELGDALQKEVRKVYPLAMSEKMK